MSTYTEKQMKAIKQSIDAMDDKNFCPSCWMILSFDVKDIVECRCCSFSAPIVCYDAIVLSQSDRILHDDKLESEKLSDENHGQEVEHLCPKCGHLFAYLKTMQLRGADEGQTCFYTCQSCKFTEKEDG